MSKPTSPASLEIKVNEQMEKFLLRSNTSQRQLLSKINSTIVNNEIVFIQKFTRPKKLVISENKSALILNEEAPVRHSVKEPKIEMKFQRSSNVNLTVPAKFTNGTAIINSHPATPAVHSPVEGLLDKYGELFRFNSVSPKGKRVSLRTAKRKLRGLCRKIKGIGNEVMSQKHKERRDFRMFEKEHEKKYLKETIREMNERKVMNCLADARIFKFSSGNNSAR